MSNSNKVHNMFQAESFSVPTHSSQFGFTIFAKI